MKKFIHIFCILLFLTLNVSTIKAAPRPITLTEGFYMLSDLDISPTANHTFRNNSTAQCVSVVIYDSNYVIKQAIQLEPQSESYNLGRLQLGYEMAIIGNGEVVIS